MRMSTFHCIQMFSVHTKNPLCKPKEIYIKNMYFTYSGGKKRERGIFYGEVFTQK